MTSPANDRQPRAGIARWYGYVEDVVYVGLGLLLAAIVILLRVGSFISSRSIRACRS